MSTDLTLAGLREMDVQQIDAALARLARERKSTTNPTRRLVLARVIDTAMSEHWAKTHAAVTA